MQTNRHHKLARPMCDTRIEKRRDRYRLADC